MSAEFDFHEYDDAPIRLGPFTITARQVVHPITAYGLRVESEGASLVYSGDTGPCPELVELAAGADLLLAESAFVEAADNPVDLHLTGKQAGAAADGGRGGPAGADPHPALARRRGVPQGGAGELRRPTRGRGPRGDVHALTPPSRRERTERPGRSARTARKGLLGGREVRPCRPRRLLA